MKKSCEGCKALVKNVHVGYSCILGYNPVVTSYYFEIPLGYKPTKECPKPLTNKKLKGLLNKKIQTTNQII